MKRARLASDDALPHLPEFVPQWPGEHAHLDGTHTYVRRTPTTAHGAEPALYLHGLGGSSLNWTDLAYLLSGHVDGEAIDLPGFGFSDPGRRYRLPDAASRVVRWIEHRGRGPVHLIGNSLGGAIAVRVAGSRPDLVRTLTLVSPAMPFMDPRRSLQSRLLPVLLIPGGERLVARKLATISPDLLARQVIAACFAEPDRVAGARLLEAIEEARRRYDAPWYVAAYLRTLRGLVSSFLRAYLPGENSMWRVAGRITAPTLVIGGRLDRLVDVRVAPTVARTILDSRLLMLDGVGHVAQMERPRLVARAVAALLDEVDRPLAGAAGPLDGAARPLNGAAQLINGAVRNGAVRPLDGVAGPLDGVAGPLDGVAGPLDGVAGPLEGMAQRALAVEMVVRTPDTPSDKHGSAAGAMPA